MNLDLLLVVIGGLFVIETLSVIAQVISFRVFHRRVLRIAPLHHHFEMLGWPETTVLIRFWILAGLFAALGIGIVLRRLREDRARCSECTNPPPSAAAARQRARHAARSGAPRTRRRPARRPRALAALARRLALADGAAGRAVRHRARDGRLGELGRLDLVLRLALGDPPARVPVDGGGGRRVLFAASRSTPALRTLATLGILASVALLALVLAPGFGTSSFGASRWLGFGWLRIQPSEFAKFALCLYAAHVIAKKERTETEWGRVLRPLAIVTLCRRAARARPARHGHRRRAHRHRASRSPPRRARRGGRCGRTVGLLVARLRGRRRRPALPPRAAAQLPATPRPTRPAAATSSCSPRSGSGRATSSALGLGNSPRAVGAPAQPAHRLHLLDHRQRARPRRRVRRPRRSSSRSSLLGLRVATRAPDRFSQLAAVGISAWLATETIVNVGAVTGVLPVTGHPAPVHLLRRHVARDRHGRRRRARRDRAARRTPSLTAPLRGASLGRAEPPPVSGPVVLTGGGTGGTSSRSGRSPRRCSQTGSTPTTSWSSARAGARGRAARPTSASSSCSCRDGDCAATAPLARSLTNVRRGRSGSPSRSCAASPLVARRRPRAVVSVGGFAAFAAAVGAVVTARPLVLVDLDATPGLVHRVLRPFAVAVTAAFPADPTGPRGRHRRPVARRGPRVDAHLVVARGGARAARLATRGRRRRRSSSGSLGAASVNRAAVSSPARVARRARRPRCTT